MSWYPVPKLTSGWQIVKEDGELVAEFEMKKDCVKACEAVNGLNEEEEPVISNLLRGLDVPDDLIDRAKDFEFDNTYPDDILNINCYPLLPGEVLVLYYPNIGSTKR